MDGGLSASDRFNLFDVCLFEEATVDSFFPADDRESTIEFEFVSPPFETTFEVGFGFGFGDRPREIVGGLRSVVGFDFDDRKTAERFEFIPSILVTTSFEVVFFVVSFEDHRRWVIFVVLFFFDARFDVDDTETPIALRFVSLF